jgi:F-type H+-transporting ATPase subunit delta
MASRLSRRKIASYYAEQLLEGKDIRKELAAYLVESGRTREYELIARDIEAALAERGVLVADIASSTALSSETRSTIESYLRSTMSAKTIHLRETVDPTLIGGVKASVPGRELDATVKHALNQLKASKI